LRSNDWRTGGNFKIGEKMMTSTELKNLRKRFGLTQAKLAEMIGYSQRAVECWEYDRGRIPERVAKLILLTFEKTKVYN